MAATLASLGAAHLGAFEEGFEAGDPKERYVRLRNIPRYNLSIILCTHQNLPENQCVLVRGFRVTRVFGILPRRLRGAARPDPGDRGDDESDTELTSFASEMEVRDSDWHFLRFI